MQTTGNTEMPLLTELMSTVNTVGAEATLKALANARNKSVDLDDPRIQFVINAVLQEIAISFEQLIDYNSRTTKKRHGLIIVSYCLTRLEYSLTLTGGILGGRNKSQISRYHHTMASAKSPSRIAKYKEQFDILINTLKIKKTKNKSNARSKK